jgi:malonyl-CoA O-methyltransferase
MAHSTPAGQASREKGGQGTQKHDVNILVAGQDLRPQALFSPGIRMTSNQKPPTLDPLAVVRWQRSAPVHTPWLHEEVARRMLDRLQWIKLEPALWAHWCAVRGGLAAHGELSRRYPRSFGFVMETEPGQALHARRALGAPWWQQVLQRLPWTVRAARFEAPEAGSLDMLWANMALHESADPQALLSRWHRLLAVDGFVMFSCLGPDTVRELRDIYQALGWPAAGHQLTDMHDWGDMLVQTGFAEPVMDMERITLTYDTPARLLQELRELGRNFHPARFGALRGRRWRAQLEQALSERLPRGPDGRLQLTFELIYGHALKARPKVKVSALSAVSVQDMRSMLQQPRP